MKCGVMALLLLVGLVGCSNNNIDTAKVRATFVGEPEEEKKLIDTSMQEVEKGNYSAALKPLQVLGFRYKLSNPERAIIADTSRKIRAKAGMSPQ